MPPCAGRWPLDTPWHQSAWASHLHQTLQTKDLSITALTGALPLGASLFQPVSWEVFRMATGSKQLTALLSLVRFLHAKLCRVSWVA